MLRSKLRQSHFYALVKLLELETTQRTPEQVSVDAYELFGEGRNWCVHAFVRVRQREPIRERAIRAGSAVGWSTI
jgi:hypothetical protein